MKKINIHVVANNFLQDSRILKETKAISQSGIFEKVLIFALWENGLKEHEILDHGRTVWRVRLNTRSLPKNFFFQGLKYAEWVVKILLKLRKTKYKAVHCHDLGPLGVGAAIKIFSLLNGSYRDTKLIYDAHELETEVHSLSGFRRRIAKIVEKIIVKYADYVITVSKSIAVWYAKKYAITEPTLVRNIPILNSESKIIRHNLKDELSIGDEEILFIYHGGLSAGRGLNRLFKIFTQVNQNHHIVFMGFGSLLCDFRDRSNYYQNIHTVDAVPPDELISYLSDADIGIYLMENSCLNHYYSLPNKLFEITLSGLPIIISNLFEQRQYVDKFQCGWVASNVDEEVVDLINGLQRAEIEAKAMNADRIRRDLRWEGEENKLLKVYNSLLGNQ